MFHTCSSILANSVALLTLHRATGFHSALYQYIFCESGQAHATLPLFACDTVLALFIFRVSLSVSRECLSTSLCPYCRDTYAHRAPQQSSLFILRRSRLQYDTPSSFTSRVVPPNTFPAYFDGGMATLFRRCQMQFPYNTGTERHVVFLPAKAWVSRKDDTSCQSPPLCLYIIAIFQGIIVHPW